MNAIRATALLATITVAATASHTVVAQNQPKESTPMTTTTTAQPLSQWIPQTHQKVARRAVTVDGEAAELTRYERRDGRNAGLGGEHFSTVVEADGKLKGFANISLDLAGRALPSRERTEQIARAFLQEAAPDLLPRMKISWIEPHDESIRVARNGSIETVTLTGMKVKARNLADGRWFWVIVGSNEKPLVFERDIVWVTFPGHRKTEKWLHDAWLKEQPPAVAKQA